MNLPLVAALTLLSLAGTSLSKPKVICYWANWSGLKAQDIDASLCTHLHYAFFVVDDQNNVIKDSAGHPQPELYNSLLALKKKNPDLKVIPSVGGWGHPDIKFSNIVSNPQLRTKFIDNTLQLLKKYNFDGLDLDWEYPVCWMGNCSAGPPSNKQNYGIFVKVTFLISYY